MSVFSCPLNTKWINSDIYFARSKSLLRPCSNYQLSCCSQFRIGNGQSPCPDAIGLASARLDKDVVGCSAQSFDCSANWLSIWLCVECFCIVTSFFLSFMNCQMPFAFIPFSEREPAYQRFEDDRLTQRDIGLSAIFTVRQAIMNQIRAHDRNNDITALAAMDDHEFF